MLQPIPYLAFNGNCAEAMRHYAQILGGKLGIMTNRFGCHWMINGGPVDVAFAA